jgi:hypothetical protein
VIEVRIKTTEVRDLYLVVLTAKLTDARCPEPLEKFSLCVSSGLASRVARFATEAAVLERHDAFVRGLRRVGGAEEAKGRKPNDGR